MRKPKYRSFEQLYKVGSEYYRDRGFCTVIALASATGWSFGKAQAHMKRYGRPDGKGPKIEDMLKAYEAAGLRLVEQEAPAKTLGAASKSLFDGVYFVLSTRHISAVRFGKLDDWATESNRKRVLSVWRVQNPILSREEVKKAQEFAA